MSFNKRQSHSCKDVNTKNGASFNKRQSFNLEDVNTEMAEGLTNVYIDSVLFKCCPNFFRGTFSSNSIPKELSQLTQYAVVVNHSKDFEPGTHFVCIVSFRTHVLYLDSYALPCTNDDICSFLLDQNKTILHNENRLQHAESNFCGFYCIFWVLYFSHRNTVSAKFSSDLMANDKLCIQYICKLLE